MAWQTLRRLFHLGSFWTLGKPLFEAQLCLKMEILFGFFYITQSEPLFWSFGEYSVLLCSALAVWVGLLFPQRCISLQSQLTMLSSKVLSCSCRTTKILMKGMLYLHTAYKKKNVIVKLISKPCPAFPTAGISHSLTFLTWLTSGGQNKLRPLSLQLQACILHA